MGGASPWRSPPGPWPCSSGGFVPAGAAIFLAILLAALGTWLDRAFPDPDEGAGDAR